MKNQVALEWTEDQVRVAPQHQCQLCSLSRETRQAVTLAVVVGFGSDGSGGVTLQYVCRECAREHNVVPCVALEAAEPPAAPALFSCATGHYLDHTDLNVSESEYDDMVHSALRDGAVTVRHVTGIDVVAYAAQESRGPIGED